MQKIIIVQGKKGSGKTYLTYKRLINGYERVVIYDSVRGYAKGEAAGIYRRAVHISNLKMLQRFLTGNYGRKYRVNYIPQATNDELQVTEFNTVSRMMSNVLNAAFAVDEVDQYVTRHKIPGHFNGLVQRGRHINLSIIATTRRHAETSRMLTAQADEVYSFKQTEGLDLKNLKNYFGSRAEDLKNLGQYEYLKYDATLQKVTKGKE